jgi:hypothetical protein
VANPNCSTIQMVVALEALRRAAGLARVVATTFQSVSGAGETGRDALRAELLGRPAGGLALHAGDRRQRGPADRRLRRRGVDGGGAEDDGRDAEDPAPARPAGGAACVRVPVDVGHAVQVMVETERDLGAEEARAALAAFPGVGGGGAGGFPTPLSAAGRDEVFVGRIRADPHLPAPCTCGWWPTTSARAPRPTPCRSWRRWVAERRRGGRTRARAAMETSAGGVIFRRHEGRVHVLLIRDAYQHWGLPKGHVEGVESAAEAALREVEEETGLCQLRLGPRLRTIDWFFRFRGR